MGMFDEVIGEINCNHCGKVSSYYDQFKWSDCMLMTYELGDFIPEANEGYDFIYDARPFHKCDHCNEIINGRVVLRDGQVIAFLNEDEFKNIDLDSIPSPEEGLGKKLRYMKDCERAIGQTNEFEDFEQHPKNIGDKIVALGHEWKIIESFRKDYDKRKKMHGLLRFAGSLGRKSERWYVYKVKNKDGMIRWIEIEDRYPGWKDRRGNMWVTENYENRFGFCLEDLSDEKQQLKEELRNQLEDYVLMRLDEETCKNKSEYAKMDMEEFKDAMWYELLNKHGIIL